MKINVKVKPNSKQESVELQSDGSYLVRVNAPPVEGEANERTRELLAKFLGRPKSALQLIKGSKSKQKVFELS